MFQPISEEEPATQEEAESSFEPATQEDPPATQEDPASAPNAYANGSSSDEDGAVANDENGAPSTGSSGAPLTVSWAHEQPKRQRSEPSMARRAEVSWHTRLSRTISIDRLPQEGKRMNHPFLTRQPSEIGIDRRVISLLLRPSTWAPNPDGSFALTSDEILQLCELAQPVLESEPTLLQLSAPVKVFGDIHGQYADLMRLFDQYGSPSREAGDINLVDYLFLGDYVDRGKHSLEVICLLVALKVQFPNRVFLVRGNHESPEVNARDGFLHECVQRLGGRPPGVAAWRRLNLLFEWLPMGALINGCILGVHGGIGEHVRSPGQIARMQRPLRMGGAYASLLLDLLWSDPTSSDAVHGVHVNEERGAPVVCYGPDRVRSFLEENGLSLIVRAHECVMDGFQRFAGGRLVTVFSATNYCNRWANAGAILVIGKDLEITPKMIYPLDDLEDAWIDAPRPAAASGVAASPSNDCPHDLKDMRPPTPPRDCSKDDEWRESPRKLRQPQMPPSGGAPSVPSAPSPAVPPKPLLPHSPAPGGASPAPSPCSEMPPPPPVRRVTSAGSSASGESGSGVGVASATGAAAAAGSAADAAAAGGSASGAPDQPHVGETLPLDGAGSGA
jgi:diadenosine tetraphosphatase ApaH/serine/threonine PP2A family protein phosphatase